jgi:hypothetical protein
MTPESGAGPRGRLWVASVLAGFVPGLFPSRQSGDVHRSAALPPLRKPRPDIRKGRHAESVLQRTSVCQEPRLGRCSGMTPDGAIIQTWQKTWFQFVRQAMPTGYRLRF